MSEGKTGRGSDQFPLRFPDGMRERIKEEAERNKRSMNAEIVARLEQSFIASALQEQVTAFGENGERPSNADAVEEAVRQIRSASEQAIVNLLATMESGVSIRNLNAGPPPLRKK